ncbi:C-X-C motif chemokine 10 [Brienomyrus brachyistius]|uniref:C-X-C motif chemokine 10 n=1 Tax=Brienomyrus brachyistius TaxID=42636 RepID=UPI0020B35CEC|nr:C-X-C motif chemokine 10 [Brienomyrus brachyistius]
MAGGCSSLLVCGLHLSRQPTVTMAPIRSCLLFSALTLICLALLQVSEGRAVRRKCRCMQVSSCINPKTVKEIQIIPQTAMCHRTEIVMMTYNRGPVCVDPNTPCIKKIIQTFTKETTTTKEMGR